MATAPTAHSKNGCADDDDGNDEDTTNNENSKWEENKEKKKKHVNEKKIYESETNMEEAAV